MGRHDLVHMWGVQQRHGGTSLGRRGRRYAERRGSTVQQRSALLHLHAVDVICNKVKKLVEARVGSIRQRQFYVLDAWRTCRSPPCTLMTVVMVGRQHGFVLGCHSVAEEETLGYLGRPWAAGCRRTAWIRNGHRALSSRRWHSGLYGVSEFRKQQLCVMSLERFWRQYAGNPLVTLLLHSAPHSPSPPHLPSLQGVHNSPWPFRLVPMAMPACNREDSRRARSSETQISLFKLSS